MELSILKSFYVDYALCLRFPSGWIEGLKLHMIEWTFFETVYYRVDRLSSIFQLS